MVLAFYAKKKRLNLKFPFGSAISQIDSKATFVIVLSVIHNNTYYRYLFDLISKLEKRGVPVLIVDLRIPNSKFSRATSVFRLRERKSKNKYFDACRSAFIMHVETNFKVRVKTFLIKESIKIGLIRYRTLNAILSVAELSVIAERSIRSFSATHLLKQCDPNKRLGFFQRLSIWEQIHLNREIRSVVNKIFESENIADVLFLNGRVPDQSAVLEACKLHVVGYFSLEHGALPSQSYHLQRFQTQDNDSFQKHFWATLPSLNNNGYEDQLSAAEQWIKSRVESPPNFGVNMGGPSVKNFVSKHRTLVLFTSSISEFDEFNIGPNGSNQVFAIVQFLKSVRNTTSFEVVVRIHPNQINYMWSDLVSMYSAVRPYADRVILPWEPISSYNLSSEAEICVFWDSTLGLETLLNSGREIFVLNSTFYDSLNGVTTVDVFDIPTFEKIGRLSDSDRRTALRYVYYRFIGHGEEVLETTYLKNLVDDLIKIKNPIRLRVQKSRIKKTIYFLTEILALLIFRSATIRTVLYLFEKCLGRLNSHRILRMLLDSSFY